MADDYQLAITLPNMVFELLVGGVLSSVIVPIIAMALSTVFEGYRWTPLAAAGAVIALGGMLGALSRSRSVVPAPDAA